MPTYDYECTRCGLTFEEFKPMSAPKRQRCPECRGKVERLISGGTGIHFKGSGFYINDSRDKKSETASAPSTGSESPKPQTKSADSSSGNKE